MTPLLPAELWVTISDLLELPVLSRHRVELGPQVTEGGTIGLVLDPPPRPPPGPPPQGSGPAPVPRAGVCRPLWQLLRLRHIACRISRRNAEEHAAHLRLHAAAIHTLDVHCSDLGDEWVVPEPLPPFLFLPDSEMVLLHHLFC